MDGAVPRVPEVVIGVLDQPVRAVAARALGEHQVDLLADAELLLNFVVVNVAVGAHSAGVDALVVSVDDPLLCGDASRLAVAQEQAAALADVFLRR